MLKRRKTVIASFLIAVLAILLGTDFIHNLTEQSTSPEINISGQPLVNVPAGYYESGAPFSIAFFGDMWSEAKLLGMAYDYEQATHYREAPDLESRELQENG
ncbi:hypothetical protein [Halobacillus mangrovi]|uniref:hypothetical protein n=1 Tax=Halobacillus mangrovi TaxID=402384 RepID=UPI001E62F58D|nr:hypothetical protein [Halobacillus mangrovi]